MGIVCRWKPGRFATSLCPHAGGQRAHHRIHKQAVGPLCSPGKSARRVETGKAVFLVDRLMSMLVAERIARFIEERIVWVMCGIDFWWIGGLIVKLNECWVGLWISRYIVWWAGFSRSFWKQAVCWFDMKLSSSYFAYSQPPTCPPQPPSTLTTCVCERYPKLTTLAMLSPYPSTLVTPLCRCPKLTTPAMLTILPPIHPSHVCLWEVSETDHPGRVNTPTRPPWWCLSVRGVQNWPSRPC